MRHSLNRHGPFRDRRGLLLGVLKGLGRHLGLAPWILRLAVVALAALTSFWVVLCAYLAAAIIMPIRPEAGSTAI
jgi:phage shock protein C